MPSSWHLLQSGPGDSAFNMALDEALLQSAARLGQPVLRFYSWTEPAASFGYFQKYAGIEQMTPLRPLVRRPTGGGLVAHDADWTYSLVFPPGHDWYSLTATDSYRRMHEWIQAAFARLNLATELAPGCRKTRPGQCFQGHEMFDLLWRGQKIAGAAQRRTRDGLLIQGSVQLSPLPMNLNSPEIGRRFPLSPSEGERAGVRGPPLSWDSGAQNASKCRGVLSLARADWQQAMCDVACSGQAAQWVKFEPDAPLAEQTQALVRQKYSQPSYNQKR